MEDGPFDRLAAARRGEPDGARLEPWHDLEPDLRRAGGGQLVEDLGPTGDGLRVVPEQERGRLRPRDHAVLAGADDDEAPPRRDRGAEAVGPLRDRQALEHPGPGLEPELRRGDLIDELRVAGLGQLAEEDL